MNLPARFLSLCRVLLVFLAVPAVLFGQREQTAQTRPDVIWIPSDDPVVTAMLKLAGVTRDDVVYDLGSGDGRIVIAAARDFGARGVGIELDADLVKRATTAAARAGVGDRVRFIHGNIFDPNIGLGEATVVTLFLLQSLNERLKPRLQQELRPGSRVVSNAFTMGDAWPPERSETVGYSTIYLWTIKPRAPAFPAAASAALPDRR